MTASVSKFHRNGGYGLGIYAISRASVHEPWKLLINTIVWFIIITGQSLPESPSDGNLRGETNPAVFHG